MVYAGFYPTEPGQYLKLDESVHRLALTDRAVSVNRESSAALGQGLRLGFLGAFCLFQEGESASEWLLGQVHCTWMCSVSVWRTTMQLMSL